MSSYAVGISKVQKNYKIFNGIILEIHFVGACFIHNKSYKLQNEVLSMRICQMLVTETYTELKRDKCKTL